MTTRLFALGAVAFTAIMLACAEDKTLGPVTTGSIAVSVTMDPDLREAHANMVDQVRASLWQDGARGSQRSGQSGDSVIFDNLEPGSYDVIVEGLTGGEVEYFGNRAGVSVTAGNVSRVTISNYGLFTTQPNVLTSPTTDVQFDVSFSGVAGATGYVVEWGTGTTYANTFAATGTSARISVDDPGTYNVRVRANNQWVTSGAPGDPRSIEIQADTSGNTAAASMDLGAGGGANGTHDGLNILPIGDVDWFALDLSQGDRLTAQVNTSSLSSASTLDPVLTLYHNPAGSSVAEDNSAGEVSLTSVVIGASGTHYLRVTGQAATPVAAPSDSTGLMATATMPQAVGEAGHYELVILVESSPADPTTSTISASPTSVPADGSTTSTITVQIKDAGGTNLTEGGDAVVLATTAGTLSGVTDNGDGTYTATLTAGSTAGTATITGTLNSVAMTDNATVDITAVPPDATTSTISASPTSIPADGTSTSTIMVQLKDSNSSNLLVGGDTVTLGATAGTLGAVTDNGDGTYTATLTASNTAETATVTGTVNTVSISDDASVIFSTAPLPDPAVSTISASPTTVSADGSSTSTIIVQLKFTNGTDLTTGGDLVELATTAGTLGAVTDNGDGTYTATLAAASMGATATITGTLNGVPMTDTATVTFTSVVADPATSTISAAPTSISADGSSTSTITVQIKDAGGDNLIVGGDAVVLATTAGTLSVVTDNADGTYTATLTSSTSAETATITGTLNTVAMTDNATVAFTTEPLPDPTTSTITPSPDSVPADGTSTSTITVQLKYSNGDNLTSGGDQVELFTTRGILGTVTDNDDGTYSATLTAGTSAGTATVTGTLNGVTMTDTASVTLLSLVHSVVVTPGGASISGVGTTYTFAAEARDAGGGVLSSASITWASLNPNVASIDSSTGETAAVTSGQVTIRAEADGVVGYGLLTVTVSGAAPVNLWSTITTEGAEYWYGVWGATASDVYVVGTPSSIVHYDGTTWNTMLSGTSNGLINVWGTSGTDIFAVGWNGAIRHYDGTTWNGMQSGTGTGLRGVWGASPSDVFAVGDAGTILHYDGTVWSAMASGTFGNLSGVWGTSATDVYAVGISGTILHFNGTSWTAVASGTDMHLWRVWGSSPTDIYVVGEAGEILHYDGVNWSAMAGVPPYDNLQHVWGTSPSDIYAVGYNGAVLRYNGASWSSMSSGTGNILYAVWGTLLSDVFAVDNMGLILRGVRGASVTVTPASTDLTAISETIQLSATALDAGSDSIAGVAYAWSSDNTAIATVDATGLVTASGFGTATITAEAPGGASATATINVIQQPSSVVVTPAGASISGVDATYTFTAAVLDELGDTIPSHPVTWTSLNPSIAAIDPSTGEATAVESG